MEQDTGRDGQADRQRAGAREPEAKHTQGDTQQRENNMNKKTKKSQRDLEKCKHKMKLKKGKRNRTTTLLVE